MEPKGITVKINIDATEALETLEKVKEELKEIVELKGQSAEDSYTVVIGKIGDRDFNCSIISKGGVLLATAGLIEIESNKIFHAYNVRIINQLWEQPS